MKNLSEYINEVINEARKVKSFPTDDTHQIAITDIYGDYIEFDEKTVEKIYKKNKSYYDNKGFIKDMFEEFPDADLLWYEEVVGNDDSQPIKYIQRDRQDEGWQEEK